ncbi:hypothetical protein [Microbacterium sp. CFBP9034]|uniref:hypothetical protein n=1 Tax=Microbacterium sp. CFBP9034 TaxID=3096540 RepID=UPI002A6B160B|nr:hypothetical protein [Microbacterium sp. CFBP9034]MDY0910753.1 hypothetical protein [Microbacterium sp. CFBP9034]
MHPTTEGRPLTARLAAIVLAVALLAAAIVLPASPAHAASQGSGFGAWAPVSTYGWHGSKLVGGVHTYCILPGASAPTGPSTDNGTRSAVLGLSPQQLTGINLLVTKYGQTSDPAQAAAVAWAVKAIADRDAALHHYGYHGDSLAGAINWTFSALAPQHNATVQRLAVAYYDEATRTPAAKPPGGQLVFTTDAADHRLGTVTAKVSPADATGSITLEGAVFVNGGGATLRHAKAGVAYAIRTTPGSPGRPHTVTGAGRFTDPRPAAVRHFTTPGGQDTAGPAAPVPFAVTGADAAPRVAPFLPSISTRVEARYSAGGPFVDAVTIEVDAGEWPRTKTGGYVPLAASATVYRTDEEPVTTAAVPSEAVVAGTLELVTDPVAGPEAPYRVTSEWTADEPGFYTAVWTIRADGQPASEALRMPAGYAWTEDFGVESQVTMVTAISSRAERFVPAGQTASDTVLIDGPMPRDGLDVSSSLYRGSPDTPASEACVADALVWTSPTLHVPGRGEVTVTAPAVTEPGTYYWQETATDDAGAVVHVGTCGVEAETTEVVPAAAPSPTPSAPEPAAPEPTAAAAPEAPQPPGPSRRVPDLAATGLAADGTRTIAAAGVVLLTLGASLFTFPRRGRFGARPRIG